MTKGSRMKHHPDCGYWFENYKHECTCGLSVSPKPDFSELEPWSDEKFNEWRDKILTKLVKLGETF